MKYSPAKVVGSCAEGEREEDSTKLNLHCEETNNSLPQWKEQSYQKASP